MKRHPALAVAVVTMALLTACSGQEDELAPPATISITGASVVTQADGDPYVTMTVTTSAADQLTAAEVDAKTVAKSVELATPGPDPSAATGGDPAPITPGDPVDFVDLPAGQATTFGPGAYGMWLAEAKQLEQGSTVTITLILKDAGQVVVQAPVR